MVYILAKVLSCAFSETAGYNNAELQQLDQEIEDWKSTRPISFDPIRFVPPSEKQNGKFPIIWMLSPFHGR